MKRLFCVFFVLSTTALAKYDYYDNKDYWGEESTMSFEHHYEHRFLELDRGGSYSYHEFYDLMHRLGMDDCEETMRNEYDKLTLQSGFAAPLCAAFGRASPALGGVCAGYVAVRGFFEKRGIEIRDKECTNDIDNRWKHRSEIIE